MKHIAVIGAGLAGAGAARKLRQAGHRVTVFEKDMTVGGRTLTYREEGIQVNTGAGFFTNFYPLFSELIKELGLEDQIVENPKVVTFADGERSYEYHLDSVPSFLRMPFLTLRDKLKVAWLTAGLVRKKKQLPLANPHFLAKYDTESIADFARRKLGERAYQYLVRPAIEPYWYFSCEEASVAMMLSLQAAAPSARFFTLKDGIDQVATRMLEEEDVRFDHQIGKLAITDQGNVVISQWVEEECIEIGDKPFDGVVVATTALRASNITQELDLPPEIKSFVNSQSYANNLNVYFMLPEAKMADIPTQISGCGPKTDRLAAIARHGSQIDPEQHPGMGILGVWILNKVGEDWVKEGILSILDIDGKVATNCWQLARQYHPNLPERPEKLVCCTWRNFAIPIHAPGRYKLASEAWKAQKGPVVFAGDYLTTATMEGALQSGYWAAEILDAFFSGKSSPQMQYNP